MEDESIDARRDIRQKFIELEWQQRKRLGVAPSDSAAQWRRLHGDEILKRNRYLNIDPWSDNRVALNVPEGKCDYINASPILLRCSKSGIEKRYIATQVSVP